MVAQKNNANYKTQETAAEKNEKWKQRKKKGLKFQQEEIIATILSIMGAANNPPELEAIGLQPYKKEYDALFKELKNYFSEWIKNEQAVEFIEDRCLTKDNKEKRKKEEKGKTEGDQKKKAEEKLRFVAKTAEELSGILLKYGSTLFKATWKVKQSANLKKTAEQEICMKDFYPELKTFKIFLEHERFSAEFKTLDLLVQWIQELNNHLVLAWTAGHGRKGFLKEKEKSAENAETLSKYENSVQAEKKIIFQSVKEEKKKSYKADLDLALTNVLKYCIVHYDPELEIADFERHYHKCAGIVSRWMAVKLSITEQRNLSEREQEIASAIVNSLRTFENIKNTMRNPEWEVIGQDYYMDYPQICKFLEKHPNEQPTPKDIQYIIRQKNKDAYTIRSIKEVLEKLKSINATQRSFDAMNVYGEKNWENESSKAGIKFSNALSKREYDEQEKDAEEINGNVLLNSQRESDMLTVVVAALKLEHGLQENDIAKELGIEEESISNVLKAIIAKELSVGEDNVLNAK